MGRDFSKYLCYVIVSYVNFFSLREFQIRAQLMMVTIYKREDQRDYIASPGRKTLKIQPY